jgi:DNA (cytosine-5)-methyltransferase 1
MRFIELFAGIGAFRLGLERTGHKFVWANEWLERPRSIYARNFGDQPDGRDIRTISARELPDADLLVGGFPCATFSVAGKRTGFSLDDTRGTLAFEMFRLAHEKSIPYLLFENVKDSSTMTREEPLKSSSRSWMAWGMTVNGSCLTAKISESHSIEKGFSLSDILEENPDQKYFLSESQVERMMSRTKANKEEGRGFSPTFLQRSMPIITKGEHLDLM